MEITITVRGGRRVGKSFLLSVIKAFLRQNYTLREEKRVAGTDLDGIPLERIKWQICRSAGR